MFKTGWKAVKFSLLAGGMIICVKTPVNWQKYKNKSKTKLLNLISIFRKIAGNEVKVQKSITFLYTSNNRVKFKVKNTIQFGLTPLQNEILRCRFKYIQDLCEWLTKFDEWYQRIIKWEDIPWEETTLSGFQFIST